MYNWVNSFTLPELQIENATKADILTKFESFNAWALKEIEKI